MPDEPTPGEGEPTPDPVPAAPEPDPTPPEPTPQDPPKPGDSAAPEGFVEQKRFTGAIQKIQTLTDDLRTKEQELAALNLTIEQTKNDLAVKDAEKEAGYGERDKQLEAALKEKGDAEISVKSLEGKLRKIDMAKELGHPELINIIDTIPTFEDDDLQKKAMEDIIGFSAAQVKAREESLLAGVTPGVTSVPVEDAKPNSDEAWQKAVDAEADPQKRQILFDEWYDWGVATRKK